MRVQIFKHFQTIVSIAININRNNDEKIIHSSRNNFRNASHQKNAKADTVISFESISKMKLDSKSKNDCKLNLSICGKGKGEGDRESIFHIMHDTHR